MRSPSMQRRRVKARCKTPRSILACRPGSYCSLFWAIVWAGADPRTCVWNRIGEPGKTCTEIASRERTMKLVRREFLYLAGATAAFPADISIVLAQAQAARPTLSQLLRGDLEGQGQKVSETLVSTVEWGPSAEAPWHMHPGAQELLIVQDGRLVVEVEGRDAKVLNAGE